MTATGQWYRSYGTEPWREASITDVLIAESERRYPVRSASEYGQEIPPGTGRVSEQSIGVQCEGKWMYAP